jgi:hypothetical protein
VTKLNQELDRVRARARSQGTGEPRIHTASTLRQQFSTIPGGVDDAMLRDMENVERVRTGPAQGGKSPDDMTPQELHSALWQILVFRDSGTWLNPKQNSASI